jgi:hypothetical protein
VREGKMNISFLKDFMEVRAVRDNWVTGTADPGLEVQIKIYDDPSGFGIDGSRISKFFVRDIRTQTVLANYDRGWDVRPGPVVGAWMSAVVGASRN